MEIIEHPSFELWDQVVNHSDYATFFHTSVWTKIVCECYPEYQIVTKGFKLDDGEIAIFPLLATLERNKIFYWLEAMVLGGYGGPVARRRLTVNEVNEIICKTVSLRTAHLHLMGNPFADYPVDPSKLIETQFTQFIYLDDYDSVYSHFRKDKRRAIRRAQELGVTVYLATSEEDYLTYWQIYTDTLRRWGKNTKCQYQYELFHRIFNEAGIAAKLFLAKYDGRTIAGKLQFYHNQIVIGWHSATYEDCFGYHPDQYLVNEIIVDAFDCGYKIFDMGPSGGLQGIIKFKEEFGSQKKDFGVYEWHNNHLHQLYHRMLGTHSG
jgi:lipid II:glycine glycyltransferase (peptidoglycan interpeptide bridge formation enzyme)